MKSSPHPGASGSSRSASPAATFRSFADGTMAIMSNMCCASLDKKLLDSVPVLAAYGHRPTEDKSKENTMIDFFVLTFSSIQ